MPDASVPHTRGGRWTRRLPTAGAGGVLTLTIAWLLAPLSVTLHYLDDAGGLFTVMFGLTLALGLLAAARRSPVEQPSPPLLALAPWAVVVAAATGYWVSAGGLSWPVWGGAGVATVIAVASAPPIYRAGPSVH